MAGSHLIVARDTCIGQHAKAGRHAVAMGAGHYAGLLRIGALPVSTIGGGQWAHTVVLCHPPTVRLHGFGRFTPQRGVFFAVLGVVLETHQ